jgi:hypothetical protein
VPSGVVLLSLSVSVMENYQKLMLLDEGHGLSTLHVPLAICSSEG